MNASDAQNKFLHARTIVALLAIQTTPCVLILRLQLVCYRRVLCCLTLFDWTFRSLPTSKIKVFKSLFFRLRSHDAGSPEIYGRAC